jgi:hypothetical protein
MKKLEKFVNKNKCELQCTENQNKAIIFNHLQDVLTYSIVPSAGVTDYFYMQPFTGEISLAKLLTTDTGKATTYRVSKINIPQKPNKPEHN